MAVVIDQLPFRPWTSPTKRRSRQTSYTGHWSSAAAVAVFSAGFWLHRGFGTTHAALAAVGAGIAGAYATLLAAAAFYEFVPEAGAEVAR